MASAPLRLGLLSTARINGALVDAGADGVEIVAVASRDHARGKAFAENRGIARAYGSYDELLADPEVDAVYVPLPNAMHVDWSVRALEAGKHVLVEKPMSRHPSDVWRAFDVADDEGLVLMEAFMYRHLGQTMTLKRLVDEGAIGALRSVYAAFTFTLDRAGDHRLSAEQDGGALMDVGCYCVSMGRLLAGEPEEVFGRRRERAGVDMTFHGMLRFPNDVVGQFRASFELPRHQWLEVVGDEATLVAETPFRSDWGGGVLLSRGDETERIDVPVENAFRLELENFAAAAAGLAPPLLAREDAVGQARALAALYESAETGRPVRP